VHYKEEGMGFADRRALADEIREVKRTIAKMERAVDAKYEYLRKLEKEMNDAYDQSAHQEAPQDPA
jgi:prefoldin subunit 5